MFIFIWFFQHLIEGNSESTKIITKSKPEAEVSLHETRVSRNVVMKKIVKGCFVLQGSDKENWGAHPESENWWAEVRCQRRRFFLLMLLLLLLCFDVVVGFVVVMFFLLLCFLLLLLLLLLLRVFVLMEVGISACKFQPVQRRNSSSSGRVGFLGSCTALRRLLPRLGFPILVACLVSDSTEYVSIGEEFANGSREN